MLFSRKFFNIVSEKSCYDNSIEVVHLFDLHFYHMKTKGGSIGRTLEMEWKTGLHKRHKRFVD